VTDDLFSDQQFPDARTPSILTNHYLCFICRLRIINKFYESMRSNRTEKQILIKCYNLKPATLADVPYSKSPEIESQRDETRTPKKTCPESVYLRFQAQDVAEDNLS